MTAPRRDDLLGELFDHPVSFAAAAAVLPYIAVVFANAGSDSTETTAESPVQQIAAPAPAAVAETTVEPTDPGIFTIRETPRDPE